jgi:hypothetical protein
VSPILKEGRSWIETKIPTGIGLQGGYFVDNVSARR